MKLLESTEHQLHGQWKKVGNHLVADDTAKRIDWLLSTKLRKLAVSSDGWDVLYVDDRDGRKWELTYPNKEWHGGGPPALECVDEDYVISKYKLMGEDKGV